MKTSVIGYPRIGTLRELKFAVEKYLKKELTKEELQAIASKLREENWKVQKNNGIDFITSNDFSFYDNLLDTAVLLNIVPKSIQTTQIGCLRRVFCYGERLSGR